MKRFIVFALVTVFSSGACTRTYITTPTQPTTTTQTDTTNKIAKIEFRVTGNAQSVRVRFSNERDGLVQTTSTLPFFTSFTSTADNLFLSLEVTPISFSQITQFPFLSAQIFVNGDLFREATSTDFFLYTISVNGTWRK
jgi:hypothetical protein